ncbi:BREX system P-loop protein BrxC [Oribacterium sp. HCP28S3_H8]|uniref:BREX system P-loop protein BrxC n=1 Tax=Oribacterium sp. HCP28S3_H8 TaxID=3438945 RepID=UPI003F8A880E
MEIKDMFVKPIDRDLQGVIKVGDIENENVRQELEEYVVTKELQKHFADFFAAYKKGILGTTPKMGVWISGFFGSGKSHLLKILSYILENKEVGGKKAIDYFIDDHKIEDPIVLADMKLAAETPTDVVLFNIDSKSDSNGKKDKDAIVNVFLKVFNEMQGFCGAIPYLADLERKLSDDGRYDEFRQKFEEEYGSPWEESRSDFDYVQDDIVTVLADMNYMSEDASRNWCEKAIQPYRISIEEFADRVKKYIDRKGNNHHVAFLVDEVGQYIGDDRNLMLNLQTVTEDLGTACNGKAWVIVTSQQDIDSVIKVKGNDFSKIQGRFDTRLSLSSANVDAVIKKRILEKTDTAGQTLRLLYGQKETTIKNKIVFTDSVERKLYAGPDDFSEVYPFIPYQFNLLASVLTAIRTHGASGKHLSEGERSMLAMFKESAVAYMHEKEGTIIPFYAFYTPMENFLDHSHRGVIIKAYENDYINPDHKNGDVFAINVLKTLFLIKYVQDITSNIDNITTLMMTDIDEDRITLKGKVEDALKVLMRQMLVQKNGDSYVFLTDEEQEVNLWIEREDVDNADVINKVSELIFEDIYTEKKYRYPKFNGRYTFSFNQSVDDRPYKSSQSNDIGVHILTPASEITDELTKRMMSGQGHEVLVVLPNDRSFMDEVQTYLKIEKFLRRNTSSSMMQYETIKEAKRLEMRERFANAKLFLTENLKEAEIYVNGDRADIKSKDVTSRINEGLQRLVETVYNKLSYIDAPLGDSDIPKLFASSNQFSLKIDDAQEANHLASQDVLAYIDNNTQMHMKTSMKSVKDRFMKAPYGFIEEDVDYLVARLFKRGDIAFTVNGAAVSLLNKSKEEIINYITKKQFVEKLMIERKTHRTDREIKACKNLLKELFSLTPTNDDEDAMMQLFIRASQSTLTDLKELSVRYENAPYPGKDTVSSGTKLLTSITNAESTEEFYKLLTNWQDSLLDFAEDYEPIREFFKGEQKQIFDEALRLMKIYDDSKTYIVNEELENTVAKIRDILREKQPYRDIPKLPELLDHFRTIYGGILDEQEKPVMSAINDSYQRVMDVLDTKSYVAEKKEAYGIQFKELFDGVERCNNVFVLRSYADRADALKIRLLNEMDAKDKQIAEKEAAEAKRKAEEEAKKNGQQVTPVVVTPHIKTTKNVPIKSVTGTSSWRLESQEDIEKYINALKKKLTAELKDDTIINIEF